MPTGSFELLQFEYSLTKLKSCYFTVVMICTIVLDLLMKNFTEKASNFETGPVIFNSTFVWIIIF